MTEPTNEEPDTVLFVAEGGLHLMDPNTFEQEEVPAELFGSGAAYLAPDASVTLLFGPDGKAVSGGKRVAHSQPCPQTAVVVQFVSQCVSVSCS